MGGRGKSSGKESKQMNIDEFTERNKINRIIKEGEAARSSSESDGGIGGVLSTLYKRCACCEEYSIPIKEQNYICPICDWIDDLYQNNHPNSLDGRNSICLNEAKIKYFKNK